MSDEEYYKKLESLQKYIPFLNYMIMQLKDPNKKNRDQQLNKMQSLHTMITDKRKRLKLDTLSKCEDVIIKLYEKVNHKSAPLIQSPPRIKTPPQTPASPSPPREIHSAISSAPVVIPTEKVTNTVDQNSSKSVFERLGHTDRHHIPKVDIYSSAATTLNTKSSEKGSVFSRLGTKIPDMSKPPITIEDLKTLEEDEPDKFRNSSLQELNSIKEQLEKQIAQEENVEPKPDDSINTTIRNQTVPVNVKPIPTQTASKSKDSKESSSSETSSSSVILPEKPLVKPFPIKSIHNKAAKVIKDSCGIFGNVLSSIDEKLLEGKKKEKKDDRRNSMTDDDKLLDKKREKSHSKDASKSQDVNSSKEKKSHESELKKKDKKESPKVKVVDLTKLTIQDTHLKSSRKDDEDVRIVSYTEGKQSSSKNEEKAKDYPVYQRLAHKYNPKPRKTSIEITEIDKPPQPQPQHCIPIIPLEKTNHNEVTIDLRSPLYTEPSSIPNKPVEINLTSHYNINDDTQMLNNKTYKPPYQTSNCDNQNTNYPMMVPAPTIPVHQMRTEPVYNQTNQFNVRPQFVPPSNNQFCPLTQTQHGFQQPNNAVRFEAPLYSNHMNFNQNTNRFDANKQYAPNYGNNTQIIPQPMISPSPEYMNNTNQVNNEYFMPPERDNRMGWNRNDPRIKRDPRNYREYREMKEKEVSEPRDHWDNAKEIRSPNEFSKDPRCNRELGRDRNLKEIERDPRIRDNWNRSRSKDRRFDNRFDKSRSRSRPGTSFANDSFVSPLDKLYNNKNQKAGKGYGMQNFKIPKIRKEDETPKPLNDEEPDLIIIEEDSESMISSPVKEREEFGGSKEVEIEDIVTRIEPRIEPPKPEKAVEKKKIEETTQKDLAETSKTTDESKKSPEKVNSDAAVTEVQPSEPKSQPTQPESRQDGVVEESTLTEKNILLKFFASLLGTENKDRKKGALLSLISTFSESIGEKQIQRITNIIEHGDKSSDEDEEDDEDKEEKNEKSEKETKKASEKEATVEEPASVKKKPPKKTNVKPDIKEKLKPGPKKGAQKQTPAPPPAPSPSKGKAKQKEDEVVESIGERIKNRKKKAISPPKKKYRSELDMLHEDIQEMFIRDGVLTATGKRMCRMLKNDPNALSSSSSETPKRKKPGPKSKTRIMDDLEMKAMSSVRVVLSKMPDELVKDDQRRLLRSATKKNSNDMEESSDSEKESDQEMEENSGKQSPEKEKEKKVKRKRKSSWATGTIKKAKKRKTSEDVSDSESEVLDDANDRTYIEPDKNYYATSTKVSCKLCSFSGRFISNHYRAQHSEYEVLNSRLSPEAAEGAIKDSEENLERYEKEREGRTKATAFSCRICGFTTRREPTVFYDHITIHTGEFRYYCSKCNYICGSKKSMTNHCSAKAGHQSKTHPLENSLKNFIFGYMCGDCNYVQLSEKNVQEHIKIYHLGDTKIIKINLSKAQVEVLPKKDKKRKIDDSDAIPERLSISKDPEENSEVNNSLEFREITVGSKKRAAKEKAEEKMKLQCQIENSHKDDVEETTSTSNKAQVKKDESGESEISISSESDDKKVLVPKEIEKNVFTCETDVLDDNKTIEDERLQKMQELNKTVGSRSSLNFVDQLSNRLLNEKENSEEEITVKEEFLDVEEAVKNEKDNKLIKFSPKPEMSSPILATHLKKPILESPYTSPKVDGPPKNNQFISGLLQKLKGVLESDNSADKIDKNPPPLFHLNQVKYNPVDANIVTFDAGSIKVIRNNDVITFACLESPCAFSTTDKDVFQHHCKEMHYELPLTTCNVCKEIISDSPVLEGLLIHITNNHSEFFQNFSPSAIRTRRLSGDMLSLKEDLFNDLPDLTDVDLDLLCNEDMEKEKTTLSDETKESEDSEPVSMVELQMDDENPFPFKIAGVMSLAEPQLPPLTPIQLKLQRIGISSETKMTASELNKVRKTQAALQKLLDRMNELYKCPHFNCPYSTEYKDMFDIHIKSHQDDPNAMIPCVYCDMKTTVRHIRRHIELRHAHCRFACAYCLYRAYLSEYVVCHQNSMHPMREVSVKTVPTVTMDINITATSERVPNPQTVCTKMVCKKPCGKEFLYINDFLHHLTNDHESGEKLECGYDRCNYSFVASLMANHWTSFHSICTLQCAYCKFSSNEMKYMRGHFANHHQNVGPYIYIRQGHIGLGYCSDAFKLMRQVANFKPIGFLKTSPMKSILKLKTISSTSPSTSQAANSIVPNSDPAPPPPLLTLNANPKTTNSIGKKIVEKIVQEMTLPDEPLIVINSVAGTNEVDPLNLDSDMDTSHELDVSTNDDDINESNKKENVKAGLKGADLYRCMCGFSGLNSMFLKKHLISSPACKRNDSKPYECVHCSRLTRNPQSLIEHIQYHGVLRFCCSLCNTKSPSVIQIRGHMKCRHNITKVSYTPLNPEKKNLESDEFVVRPKLSIAPETPKETPVVEQTSSPSLQVSYTPDQIDKIPIRSIFSNPVKCGVCQYSTKVRTNLVRHLQFHSQEIYVPDTAPVNPVPCLDKNEKMFDKMTNLAMSSFAGTGRMGAKTEKADKVESESLPEFVPIHGRYVCCAEDCNYLCPEEANLRHHLIALHDANTKFTCAHCKMPFGPTDADNLIKHFKLHGLHLYKCGNCAFLHHLRHKVERHFNDNHANFPLRIITVRSLEAEPTLDDFAPKTAAQIMQKAPKLWRCCMCKARGNTKEDIESHVLAKHEIDSQYKCALCSFKSNDIDTFDGHFKEVHPDKTTDIISAYCKADDGKKTDPPINFDTTPLWLRDKPRVRHIRGILFEESSPQPKSAKKTPKIVVPVNPSPMIPFLSDAVPSTSGANKRNSHLDLAIDAVATGTADILKVEDDPADVFTMIDKELNYDKLFEHIPKRKEDVIVIDDEEVEEKTVDELMTTHYDYEDEKMSVKSLVKQFGAFGTPIGTAFQCPLCSSYQTEQIIQFIHHIFKDLNYRRFSCKLCSETTVTSNAIITHLYNKHLEENSPKYDIKVNNCIEIWVRMVIYHQSRIIVKNNPKVNDRKGGGALECKICKKRFLQYTDLTRHKHVHWSRIPFLCVKCNYETFWIKNLELHCNSQHGSFKKVDIKKKSLTVTDLLNEMIKKSSKLFNKLKSTVMLNGTNLLHDQNPVAQANKQKEQNDSSSTPTTDEHIDVEEPSPTILIRSEIIENEIDPNRYYFCLICAYVAKTKQEVKDHSSAMHNIHEDRFKEAFQHTLETLGCLYCKFIGDELKLREHHAHHHSTRVYKPIKYMCALCGKRSIRIANLKSHFKYIHPNATFAYKEISEAEDVPSIVEPEPGPSKIVKEKLFSCTFCKYTTQSGKSANMKWHLQSHFLAYSCGNCGKTFKTLVIAKKHHLVDHPNEAENVLVDEKMLDDFTQGLKAIIRSAKQVTEGSDMKVTLTARKSTGKPRSGPVEKEFSFYGSKPEESDLKAIMATVEMNQVAMRMTVEQLSKKINLFPLVEVDDYYSLMNLNKNVIFDSSQEEDIGVEKQHDDFEANVGLLSPTDFSDVEDTFALENIVPSLDSLFSSVPEPFNF